jgi:hypothetical protein
MTAPSLSPSGGSAAPSMHLDLCGREQDRWLISQSLPELEMGDPVDVRFEPDQDLNRGFGGHDIVAIVALLGESRARDKELDLAEVRRADALPIGYPVALPEFEAEPLKPACSSRNGRDRNGSVVAPPF